MKMACTVPDKYPNESRLNCVVVNRVRALLPVCCVRAQVISRCPSCWFVRSVVWRAVDPSQECSAYGVCVLHPAYNTHTHTTHHFYVFSDCISSLDALSCYFNLDQSCQVTFQTDTVDSQVCVGGLTWAKVWTESHSCWFLRVYVVFQPQTLLYRGRHQRTTPDHLVPTDTHTFNTIEH